MNSMPMMEDARRKTLAFASSLQPDAMSAWPDEAFSPICWHLGHIAFTEAHWALKRCGGKSEYSVPYARRFAQGGRAKSQRADGFEREKLFAYLDMVRQQVQNDWNAIQDSELGAHGYLDWFLACHEHQHRETMQLVLALSALDSGEAFERAAANVTALRASTSERQTFRGEGILGSDSPKAYDNERPVMRVSLPDFTLATKPVSCGEWASFISEGGYETPALWCDEGWTFAQTMPRQMPRAWRRAGEGYVLLAPEGARPVASDEAVWGVSWYEAMAYARWVGAELPSEAEWELAARQGLTGTGAVWEWCACTFDERPGFRAHPYASYSTPYFDGKHRVMRGGSFATDPAIARPGFRNWFVPETRQVFAGVRLRFRTAPRER
jgi:iron(II)-dependent oxidoreductase